MSKIMTYGTGMCWSGDLERKHYLVQRDSYVYHMPRFNEAKRTFKYIKFTFMPIIVCLIFHI